MARISLRIYSPLAQRVGLQRKSGSLVLEEKIAETEEIGSLLNRLADKYGEDFRQALFDDETGELRRHIAVLVNGRMLASLQGLETGLVDGDEVALLPAYAGG